jgi:hypothetical protein
LNKLAEFIHNFWIKAQLQAPPYVQQGLMPRLHESKELIRLLIRPQLPVYQLKGYNEAGPLGVTYVGLGFARPVLTSLLFTDIPSEQEVDRIPFWQLEKLANLSKGDVVIIEATKQLVNRLPRQHALVLPEFVRHILDVQGTWDEVQSRFRKTVQKNDLRRIRKYGYEYDVSHNDQDFNEFYHQMYLPTMQDRHNNLSMPTPYYEAYQIFRHGYLFRLKRDGVWVAGGVCHPEQKVLLLDIIGVRHADAQLIQEGAMAARYYAAIHWANQHGYSGVNFLGSGPYLKEGQFQYKRKWGTQVFIPPHLHRRIWLKVNQATPAVIHFLQENPLIVVDEQEHLHGLITVEDMRQVTPEAKAEWEKLYGTPGLQSLRIRSAGHLVPRTTKMHDSEIIIPLSLSHPLEQTL